ncbi:MAG: sporulation protein YqfD [Oscillospiraceae bacterium]
MKIHEYCNVTAKGGNPYPFVNAIRQSPLPCYQQYCKGEIFYFQVRKQDVPALKEIAKYYHMELKIEPVPSVIGKIKNYRFHFGIIIGLILGICLIFYQSNVVNTIEIQGNQQVAESVILSLLDEEGVKRGTWISEIDMLHCERMLRAKIPELAWAGIRHTGNRLVVEVTERTPKPKMQNKRIPCNIVSRYDAQVTNVRVYSGHLQCLIGDGVAKGQMLVSGMFQDANGLTSWHHAIASITGIYTQNTELSEPFEMVQTLPTGRTFTQKWFQIFGLSIPLTFGEHDFTEYQTSENQTNFSFFSKTLPCGILKRTITETATSQIIRTEEEILEELERDRIRYENNFLSHVKILKSDIQYDKQKEKIICRLSYQVEGEIGKESDFFVK